MIREQKKHMCYTYFHRKPRFHWKMTHLFSPVKKNIPGMIRVPCPTMIADIRECDFIDSWSKSVKTKINKAETESFSIVRDNALLPDILEMFQHTAGAKSLRGHYPSDFDSRPWILCSAIFENDKMLAGHVWLIDEEEKRSLLFVNASAHYIHPDTRLVSRAHYYLLYQDGCYLRNNGIDCLDLNGYKPGEDDPELNGVYRWKEGTHGQSEELYHYYPAWFYWLRKMRNRKSG